MSSENEKDWIVVICDDCFNKITESRTGQDDLMMGNCEPDRKFLFDVVRFGIEHILKSMIVQGVDISVRDDQGMTPLMWAGLNDETKCLRILLQAGACIDEQDCQGWSPLMYAALSGNPYNVTLILKFAGSHAITIRNDAAKKLIDIGATHALQTLHHGSLICFRGEVL